MTIIRSGSAINRDRNINFRGVVTLELLACVWVFEGQILNKLSVGRDSSLLNYFFFVLTCALAIGFEVA